jgi:hypothetical protein
LAPGPDLRRRSWLSSVDSTPWGSTTLSGKAWPVRARNGRRAWRAPTRRAGSAGVALGVAQRAETPGDWRRAGSPLVLEECAEHRTRASLAATLAIARDRISRAPAQRQVAVEPREATPQRSSADGLAAGEPDSLPGQPSPGDGSAGGSATSQRGARCVSAAHYEGAGQ